MNFKCDKVLTFGESGEREYECMRFHVLFYNF